MPISIPKVIDVYDRIAKLNKQIQNIENTIFPDDYEEVRSVMFEALARRIDDIMDGRA